MAEVRTMRLYIAIEREPRPGTNKQRMRVAVRTHPTGPVILTGRCEGSVAAAKADVEAMFGPLGWNEANKAVVALERTSEARA